MTRGCREFTEKLDALLAGSLTADEAERLRAHAAGCPDCAALLALQRRLAGVDAAALEAAVPDDLLEGMWPRVSEAILEAGARRRAGSRRWFARGGPAPARPGWLVPALAAAAVVLALATGFLAGRMRSLEGGQRLLAEELSRQERALAALQRPDAGGGLAEQAARWRSSAGAGDALSVGELRARLAALPPGTVLLDAAGAEALRRALPAGPGALLPAALGGRDGGGLRAGEALRLLGSLDPDTEIPPERVAALAERLRGRHPAGPLGW